MFNPSCFRNTSAGVALAIGMLAMTVFAPQTVLAQDPLGEGAIAQKGKSVNPAEPVIPLPTDEIDSSAYIESLSIDEQLALADERAGAQKVYTIRAGTGLEWLRDDGEAPTVAEIMEKLRLGQGGSHGYEIRLTLVPTVGEFMERILECYAQLPWLDVQEAGYMWQRIAYEYGNMAQLTPKRLPARKIYETAAMQTMEAALFVPGGGGFRPYSQIAASGFASYLAEMEKDDVYVGVVSDRTYTWEDALEFYYAKYDIMAEYEKEHDFSSREHPWDLMQQPGDSIKRMLRRLERGQEAETAVQELCERYPGTMLQKQLRKFARIDSH